MSINGPVIIEQLKGVTLYTWDHKFYQVDIDLPAGEEMCVGSYESLEIAQRWFYKTVINQIYYFHHELPAKVQRLLNLANNAAAYIGEVRNCVVISLKILKGCQ
ncbi:hypothetical protein [Anaeromusa acidaminophila]|uniref:hypothetical protein n=1 Tax=Anaeromusa acidaminophila TaxID=81464 RepID=UPI000382A768|nr:hypothetical protein [Anaeromusa acidaminophila]